MLMGQQRSPVDNHSANNLTVRASRDMEIAGRTIQMMQGELQGDFGDCEEVHVLLEPGSTIWPTHICVAWTLSCVTMRREVILQVMNACPTPVKIPTTSKGKGTYLSLPTFSVNDLKLFLSDQLMLKR